MKIETKAIRVALDNLRPIIGRKTTLPILSFVKLHTERNRLHISATNLDEFAVERTEVDGEFEPVCVSFNYLSMALSGESAEIKPMKGAVMVKCGDDETLISTLDAEELPPLPKFEAPKNHGVACADLSSLVDQVSWAASDDASRYVINSVLVESTAKNLRAISTNGRELAIADAGVIGSEFEVVVPSNFAANFSNALSRAGASLSSNKSYIKVGHDWGVYFCKQVEGVYPSYKGVIPKASKPLGTVSVDEFKTSVSSCVGFSSHSEAMGVFKFSSKGLLIEFCGDDNSKLSRHLIGKFADLTIGLSTKKILNIVSRLKTEDVKLSFVDNLSPLTIESGDLTVFTMPMRMS